MKVAVINFSGNVGKTTVARHLLLPRIAGAEIVTVESINADEAEGQSLRGRQFSELQEYLQLTDNVIVDIGASNVEELLSLMKRYRGSHADFDHFVVPTVPAIKQQQDTIATLVELAHLGAHAGRVHLVFNMLDETDELTRAFDPVLSFLSSHPVAIGEPACRLSANEIYELVKRTGMDIAALRDDDTDYKALIASASDQAEKLLLARRLAIRRLAMGVIPELDACFASLGLSTPPPLHGQPGRRKAA